MKTQPTFQGLGSRPLTAIAGNNPDVLVGAHITSGVKSGVIAGWSRTNTGASGQRYAGFGTYHTDVALKLEGTDARIYVTLVSKGAF